MPDSLLAALEKAHATLTPSPWFKVGPPWATDSAYINAKSDDPHAGRFVADFDGQWEDEYDDDLYPRPHEDAALIVALRNSLPALIAYVRAADALRAQFENSCGKNIADCPACSRVTNDMDTARAELARGLGGGSK